MLATRQPIDPFRLLQFEMDRLFDQYLGTPDRNSGTAPTARHEVFPAFNIWENEENFFVEAECPGLTIQDLELSITGKQLSLSGKRRDEELEGSVYHRRERGSGSFHRAILLPGDVNSAEVEGSLTNGVLTVRIPKAETAKPRKVEVKN